MTIEVLAPVTRGALVLDLLPVDCGNSTRLGLDVLAHDTFLPQCPPSISATIPACPNWECQVDYCCALPLSRALGLFTSHPYPPPLAPPPSWPGICDLESSSYPRPACSSLDITCRVIIMDLPLSSLSHRGVLCALPLCPWYNLKSIV